MYWTIGFIFFFLILALSIITFCIEKYRNGFLIKGTIGRDISDALNNDSINEDNDGLASILGMYLILFAIYFMISILIAAFSIIAWPIVGVAMILTYFKSKQFIN